MLTVMYLLTRNLFRVDFEWRRLGLLVAILGGIAVGGELALPTSGAAGLLSRALALALIPIALVVTRFFGPHELRRARELLASARARDVAV
jgi:hypothetical protein